MHTYATPYVGLPRPSLFARSVLLNILFLVWERPLAVVCPH